MIKLSRSRDMTKKQYKSHMEGGVVTLKKSLQYRNWRYMVRHDIILLWRVLEDYIKVRGQTSDTKIIVRGYCREL